MLAVLALQALGVIAAVVVGGELTLETLDLIYSESARFYEAPFQVKANASGLFDYEADSRVLEPYLNGDLGYYWPPRSLVELAVSHAAHLGVDLRAAELLLAGDAERLAAGTGSHVDGVTSSAPSTRS